VTPAAERADQLLIVGRAKEALALLLADSETATDAVALTIAADCHSSLGQNDRALALTGAALEIDPDLVEAWSSQAYVLVELKRLSDALTAARQAVELDPTNPDARLALFQVLCELGHYQEAAIHAERVCSLVPGDVAGWLAVGELHLRQEQWHEAATVARTVLDLEPQDAAAKVLLSTARLLGRGESARNEALETLSALLRDEPSDQTARELLIEVARARLGGPSLPVAVALVVVLSLVTGGLALVVMCAIWTAGAIRRWRRVPDDVRQLIWADRRARRRMMFAGAAVALGWVGILTASVAAVLALLG
jgi:tetratricopeptide (TPR) repeat protein